MKLSVIAAGKTRVDFVSEGLSFYGARIKKYCQWDFSETTDVKHISDVNLMIKAECDKIIKALLPGDYVILLDEKGRQHSSMSFSNNLRKIFDTSSAKRIVFVIAGAYGASDDLLKRANETWSLSKLTFPHQLVRLILAEQIYRALTIMRNLSLIHI